MRLLISLILCAAAIAAATTVPARAARTAPATARNCGVVRAAGKRWSVGAAALSCTTAKSLVKAVAARVPGAGVLPLGKHAGLSCTAFAKTGRRVIQCLSPGGKLVQAVSPPAG